jgi:hypothetical protein
MWRIDLLNQYFMPMDIAEILKIKPSPRLLHDQLAWAPEKHGLFTQSVVHMAFPWIFHGVQELNPLAQYLMVEGKIWISFGSLTLHQRCNTLLGD